MLLGVGVLVTTTRHFVPQLGCSVETYSEQYDKSANLGMYEGKSVDVPTFLADSGQESNVLGDTVPSSRWIEINLSKQDLKAWDGNQLFLETPVSTGLPWFPTPTGEFTVWAKMRYVHMIGGMGAYAYDLPNVPFVMFFQNNQVAGYRGYSLHGTYWHNDFGHQHSHGCVNLPTSVAEKLYYWAGPLLPANQASTYSTSDNPGTRIVIHD